MKKYIALARVSSREQEREGFSLDVQEAAFQKYAAKQGGKVEYMFRIAETATKSEQRKTFKEVLECAKSHAPELDGMLFYKASSTEFVGEIWFGKVAQCVIPDYSPELL